MNNQDRLGKKSENIKNDFKEESNVFAETIVYEKNKFGPQDFEEKISVMKSQTLSENKTYLSRKKHHHQEIIDRIQITEEELANLRMRQYLIESDFPALLDAYNRYLLKEEPISSLAKASLVEYFTYELLKPLNDIHLELSKNSYDTWQTRHFSINYSINEQNELIFSFLLPTIKPQHQVEAIPLFKISPEMMEITVEDNHVLSLILYWYMDRAFSEGQITILNHKLNQLLVHARKLGFYVKKTLLDNTKPLDLSLQSKFDIPEKILDNIFILTMKNQQYDMNRQNNHMYEVLLDKGQSMIISSEDGHTDLLISSGNYHRSIIDFFINYEFLVPLIDSTEIIAL